MVSKKRVWSFSKTKRSSSGMLWFGSFDFKVIVDLSNFIDDLITLQKAITLIQNKHLTNLFKKNNRKKILWLSIFVRFLKTVDISIR